MRPSNEHPNTKEHHKWTRESGYVTEAYDRESGEYPKHTEFGIARDAEHEARLKGDHSPKNDSSPAE